MASGTGSETGGPSGTGRTAYAGEDAERAGTWDIITATAGLLFISLVVASFFTPGVPDANDSAERLATALTDDRTGHQMALLSGFLADIAFLVFLAGLWSRLRRHEGSVGMMAGLFAVAWLGYVAGLTGVVLLLRPVHRAAAVP